MPAGGSIPPDGRPPQAKGVGRDAKRHDLEQPATPGLSNSDLQQGDVQRLEQAQKIAPRPKRTQQPGAAPKRGQVQGRRRPQGNSSGVPDPIEMAAGRIGGGIVSGGGNTGGVPVEIGPWLPLLEGLASAPHSSGGLTAGLINILSNQRRKPVVARANLLDIDELDRVLE